MAKTAEPLAVTEEATSREVVAGGIRLHYNEIGKGDPIIAIHGGGPGATGWSNFKGNIPDLARNNRLLMFDMPGWGRSEYPDAAIDQEWIAWMGDVLNDFMAALDIDCADFIGNSMGGQAAFGLALKHPRRVKHMVLIGSQPTRTIFFQPTPQEALNNIAKFYRDGGPSFEKMKTLAQSLVYDTTMVTDALVQERLEAATAPAALEQAARRSKQARADYYFELEKNTVPTLLIWGQEDKGGALESGLMMLKRFQNARLYVFAKCGHWAHVEHREEFDRVCLEFFRS